MTDGNALLVSPDTGVGDRLRLARVASGLTRKEMADAMEVSVRTYDRIEAGLRELRLSDLRAAIRVTGQDPVFFGASSDDDGAPTLPLLPGAVKADRGGAVGGSGER